MDNKSIGELIRKRRKEKHLTQEQLAKLLYVSTNAVSKWELGKNSIDPYNLELLSDALDIPLSQLLGDHPEVSEAETAAQNPDAIVQVSPESNAASFKSAESETLSGTEEKKTRKKIIACFLLCIGAVFIIAVCIVCAFRLSGRHSFSIHEEHFDTYNEKDACYLVAEYKGKLTTEIYDEYADTVRELYTDYFNRVDVIIILYYPDYCRDQIFSLDTADAVTVLLPDPYQNESSEDS